MEIKKLAILIAALLVINIVAFGLVKAFDVENPIPGTPDIARKVASGEMDTTDLANNLKNQSLAGWNYISTQWQQMLLKNPTIANIDEVLKRFSIVFRVLFGMPYSLSITLICVIIVWIFFLSYLQTIVEAFGFTSNEASFGISVGLVIIMAQMQIFMNIVNLLGKLIFGGGVWRNLIIAGIIIAVFIIAIVFKEQVGSAISNFLATRKKTKEELGKLEDELRKINAEKAEEAVIAAMAQREREMNSST